MKKVILFAAVAMLASTNATAVTIDGAISGDEYTWSTIGSEGNHEWGSHGSATTEVGDGSGGAVYDLDYLGFNIDGGMFQFGIEGGAIISGREQIGNQSNSLYLGDMAISLGAGSVPDPKLDSTGFDYAVRLDSVDDGAGTAEFSLLYGGTWQSTNIYNQAAYSSDTYVMTGGTVLDTFSGAWSFVGAGSADNVLEAQFDLSLLGGGYDASLGTDVAAYLTMTCVNDEALVYGQIDPVLTGPGGGVTAVPEPSVYAMMMGGLGLVGFMAARRRKQQA